MSLEAIRYSRHAGLELLDQLQLPGRMVYDRVTTAEQGWQAIHSMRVRGAPAIAIAAALALASELALQPTFASALAAQEFTLSRLARLRTSRPTAVNLGQAVDQLTQVVQVACSKQNASGSDVVEAYLKAAEDMLAIDLQANRSLGAHGAETVLRLRPPDAESVVRVLTHCNTGALATSGHGTALGVIRDLHARSKTSGFKFEAFCTETRPYLQGARLTAFELVHEGISSTLITDSMVASLLASRPFAAVLVGADRVVANGDTANKIGTYTLALVAKALNVPFYVCAPITTLDQRMETGAAIPIEQRPPQELTHVGGTRLAAEGISVWNPSFDVTPASLITAIVTDVGVIWPPFDVRTFVAKNGK